MTVTQYVSKYNAKITVVSFPGNYRIAIYCIISLPLKDGWKGQSVNSLLQFSMSHENLVLSKFFSDNNFRQSP